LTGVRTRAAGLRNLDNELDRCRRSNEQLVVCYIDVVGLKALNDSRGHGAGDELLKRVVTLIKAHLRSYDLVIRLGGDEFLCAMSSMTLPDARKRFSDVTALLAASPDAGAIRTGFSQLTPDETAANLIARADNELLISWEVIRHRSPRTSSSVICRTTVSRTAWRGSASNPDIVPAQFAVGLALTCTRAACSR